MYPQNPENLSEPEFVNGSTGLRENPPKPTTKAQHRKCPAPAWRFYGSGFRAWGLGFGV